MRIVTWIFRILLVVTLFMVAGLVAVLVLTNKADSDALDILDMPHVTEENRIIILDQGYATHNLIFYQGGLVETEAYLVLLNQLSEQGIRVFAPKMPLNLAILGRSFVDIILEQYPSDLPWVVMGHSLGGAALSFVVDERFDSYILLASYPAESVDLSDTSVRVLSITASLDGVLNRENFNLAKERLPLETVYMDIEGGNHAQFGHYGKQRNDNDATISRETQQDLTVQAILQFLDLD